MENLELYIEVDADGNPVNHPILGENLRGFYVDGLRDKYHPFKRIPKPEDYAGGPNDLPKYEKIDGVWQDVWN